MRWNAASRAVILSLGSVIAAAIVGTLIVDARDNNSRTPSTADASTCESGLALARADVSSATSDPDTGGRVLALYQGSEDVSMEIRDALRDWSNGYTKGDPSIVSNGAQDFVDECHVSGAGP